MQWQAADTARQGTMSSLRGLALTGIACTIILAIALTGEPVLELGPLSLGGLLVAGLLAGSLLVLLLAGVALAIAVRRAAAVRQTHAAEISQLQRRANGAEAMLRLEPQALVTWEPGQPPRLVGHGLPPQLGVPRSLADLLRFQGWLETDDATRLSGVLDELLRRGEAFALTTRSRAGNWVDVEGRIAGGRALLRFRDASGSRRELAESNERHRGTSQQLAAMRSLCEAMATPAWSKGSDGRIDWCNPAYVRAVGAPSREDVRQRQTELLESRVRSAAEIALKAGRTYRERVNLVIGGERRSFDVLAVQLDGATAFMATDAAALETAKGELTRLTAANDRTLDRVATAVAIFGPDQRLKFYNDAYRKLWGHDAAFLETHPKDSEILDRLREQRQLPEEADYRAWKAKQLACYGTVGEHEDWWHLPGGRTLHVVAEQRPDGGVAYLYDDATQMLSLESRYNALIGVQSETLDHLREGVAVFATDGRLRLFNPAFARIWKLNPKDLAREPHIDEIVRRCRVLYDDEPTWTRFKRAVTAISDRRERIEGQMSRPDESVIAYAGLPLPDGAMLLTFIDISDSKRVERALIERNEALEAGDRLKSQFISHVSYELRTPLTNIIGFSELLASPRTGTLNDKQREYLGDIGASSKTLLSIINDILDLATIDAGAFELRLQPVAIREVVDSAALGVRERLSRARLKLELDIAPDVQAFVADGNRVKQVLYNLLSNAIGFSDQGSSVTLRCRRDNGMIAFTVEDRGAGIPEEQQSRVFDRFVSRTQGSKHRGAGLGLALVKSLVELHGGDVGLVSAVGKGTRVTVRFPEGGTAAAAPAGPPPRRAGGRGRPRQAA
jgi:signal transduction histidine kinase